MELLWAPFRENITLFYNTFFTFIWQTLFFFTQPFYDVVITDIMLKLTNSKKKKKLCKDTEIISKVLRQSTTVPADQE